jgi:hypothetical protein
MNRIDPNLSELFSLYETAIANEIKVDERAYKETGLDKVVNFIPLRPYHTHRYIKHSPNIAKVLFYIISNLWFLFNFFIQTFFFVVLTCEWIISRKKDVSSIKRFIIVATPRMVPQLKKIPNIEVAPVCHLILKRKYRITNDDTSIYSIIKFRHLLYSYIIAITFPFSKRSNLKNIQSYTCLKWVVVYLTLSKLKNVEEIWFGNHYDRWAVLFDLLPIKTKVIVQHGVEDGKISTYPLKTISKIYFISKDEIKFFKKLCVSNFEYEFLNSTLILTKLGSENTLNALIIGNVAVYSALEEKIISALNMNARISLIVKPHPIFEFFFYEKLLTLYNFIFIRDKNIFPDVDIVISYNSTLAVEYSQMGKTVLYYENHSVDEIVNDCLRRAEEK